MVFQDILLLISQDGGRCWERWFVGGSDVVALRWLFQRESENPRGLLAGLAVSGSFLQQFLNFLNPESLVVSAFLHFLFGDDFFHFKLLERDLGISFPIVSNFFYTVTSLEPLFL